jgi:hypothetical protein
MNESKTQNVRASKECYTKKQIPLTIISSVMGNDDGDANDGNGAEILFLTINRYTRLEHIHTTNTRTPKYGTKPSGKNKN